MKWIPNAYYISRAFLVLRRHPAENSTFSFCLVVSQLKNSAAPNRVYNMVPILAMALLDWRCHRLF